MRFDIATLTWIMMIIAFLMAGILVVQYRFQRDYTGPGWWALGGMSGVGGFALMLLRDTPMLRDAAIIIGNGLFLGVDVCFYIGIKRFIGQRESWRILGPLLVIAVSFHVYHTLIVDDLFSRTMGMSLAIFALCIINAEALLRDPAYKKIDMAVLLGGVFFVHGGVMLARAILLAMGGVAEDFFVSSPAQVAVFLSSIICSSLWSYGFIGMMNQRVNDEMREAKERFEAIFNTSPDAAIITRVRDGRIVDVNEGFLALTGYARADVVGQTTTRINIWKNAEEQSKYLAMIQQQGFCENMEAVFLPKDGRDVAGMISGKVTLLQGTPHVISIARDISSRRQAEEALRQSEEMYRSIVSASPDGVIITNLAGEILMASPKALGLIGASTLAEVVGKLQIEFLAPEDRERARQNIALMFQGVFTGPGEYQAVALDGSLVDVESNAEFVRDAEGNPVKILFITRDIRDRKQAEAMQRHNDEIQRVLKEIAETALLATRLDEVYAKVHAWMEKLLGVQDFYIALVEDDGKVVMQYCADKSGALPACRPSGKGLTEYVLRQRKMVHLTHPQLKALCDRGEIELQFNNMVKEWIGVPLNDAHGRAFGMMAMNLSETSRAMSSVDVEAFSVIAAQVSMALEHKHLEMELKRQAMTDGLTGLMNRRYFVLRAEEELKRAQRYKGFCALLVIDIDHFKTVNDTYGHAVGDEALRQVTKVLHAALRDTDLIGRIGGEEFAVLLLEARAQEGAPIAERLRRAVCTQHFMTDTGQAVMLSISIGFTESLGAEDSLSNLMVRADRALYRAKAEGRNRVVRL